MNAIQRIKEKPLIQPAQKERPKSIPKELARQAMQSAAGQIRQQLREATQGSEAQDEYGTDAARTKSQIQLGKEVRFNLSEAQFLNGLDLK